MQIAPPGYWRHAARQRTPALRNEILLQRIECAWQAKLQTYGAEEVWRLMRHGVVSAARSAMLPA